MLVRAPPVRRMHHRPWAPHCQAGGMKRDRSGEKPAGPRLRALYERRRSEGVCVRCGGSRRTDNTVTCEPCLARTRVYKARYRDKQRGGGEWRQP